MRTRMLPRSLAALAILAALAVPIAASADHCGVGVPHAAGPVQSGRSAPCPSGAVGGVGDGGSSTALPNPLDDVKDIPTILGRILRAGFGVLGSLALVMFLYGGFAWLTSAGSAEKIKKGQDTMVWAVLGIAVIFASYAIVNFVILALTK